MRTLIVDTNIVFNALITSNSQAATIILNPSANTQLVSCHFLSVELFKHKERISQLSGLTDEQLIDLLYELTSRLTFVNEAYIPFICWRDANALLTGIDPNDMPFLALAIHLDADLWTGDRRLTNGLRAKGYHRLISTAELVTSVR